MPILRIEDLSDGVRGAGREATQMPRGGVCGSLALAGADWIVISSGPIGGRVARTGPLSIEMGTFGIGLRVAPGTCHRMREGETGAIGVVLPGDEHGCVPTAGTLHATVTLPIERLEAEAARIGVALDPNTPGGTGFHARGLPPATIAGLRTRMEAVHVGRIDPCRAPSLGRHRLSLAIGHHARDLRPIAGPSRVQGQARFVARARALIFAHLDEASRSHIRRLGVHCIRHDLATEAEAVCTVAIGATRRGIGELRRLSGWYRDLFGELPFETLSRRRRPDFAA